jgi:hypothetical protein
MKKNKSRVILRGMLLAKKVREFAGLNPWKMHQKMNKKTVQAYITLERNAKRISLADLLSLRAIYMDSGGTVSGFDKLLQECAEAKK